MNRLRLILYAVFGIGFTASLLIFDLMIPALGKFCEFLLRPAAMLTRHDILTLTLGLFLESILVAIICGLIAETLTLFAMRRKL